MADTDLFAEANRQLVICNACRYCEGLCPVFRAIETRRDFGKATGSRRGHAAQPAKVAPQSGFFHRVDA